MFINHIFNYFQNEVEEELEQIFGGGGGGCVQETSTKAIKDYRIVQPKPGKIDGL